MRTIMYNTPRTSHCEKRGVVKKKGGENKTKRKTFSVYDTTTSTRKNRLKRVYIALERL